jgi:SPP1 gp7 family putative phage head morphogenesis protein
VIGEIEFAGVRVPDLDKLLSTDLQLFDNLLSMSALASYLLAYDTANEEHLALMRTRGLAQFAEGDDEDKNSAARIGKKGKLGMDLRFDVPPQEAIDFFKRKKLLPPEEFRKLEAEAKAGAFSVANVYKMDVIEAFRDELVDALESGRPIKQVIGRLRSILNGAGHKMLGNNHLETVVRTTMQMAYGVGRRIAQDDVSDILPMWEYSAVGDDRTRPTHMALDGLQFPANHPFWNKYYPPWDFRCRCTVIATFDYRKGYDRTRPNDRAVIEYDRDGLPAGYNVDGLPGNFKAPKFAGVPSKANLEKTLNSAAERALDSRK